MSVRHWSLSENRNGRENRLPRALILMTQMGDLGRANCSRSISPTRQNAFGQLHSIRHPSRQGAASQRQKPPFDWGAWFSSAVSHSRPILTGIRGFDFETATVTESRHSKGDASSIEGFSESRLGGSPLPKLPVGALQNPNTFFNSDFGPRWSGDFGRPIADQ